MGQTGCVASCINSSTDCYGWAMSDRMIHTDDYRGPDRRRSYMLELDLHDAKALAGLLKQILGEMERTGHALRLWEELFSQKCKVVEQRLQAELTKGGV